MDIKKYEAPAVEVLEVVVEKGFSNSIPYSNLGADNAFDIE